MLDRPAMSTAEAATTPTPLVSIGMPVYNGDRYLREALDSLLVQDYPNFELVVSDNASQDSTPEICAEYAERDPRIRYHRVEENKGAIWNFQHVLDLACGGFFMWAAHDDARHPSYVSKCLRRLCTNDKAVACHTCTMLIDESGEAVRLEGSTLTAESDSPRERCRVILADASWAYAFYGLMRTSVAKSSNLLRNYYWSDQGFVFGLALHGQILQVQEPLFQYRTPREDAATNATEMREYIERVVGSLDPANGPRRFRMVRLVRGMNHARDIWQAPLPRRARITILCDLVRYYGWSDGTIYEIILLLTAALGPRGTELLTRIVGPTWRVAWRRLHRSNAP
ncbi:MAG: glycosyltransferase family 2 protein [Dehalococcoidia bacterium]